MRDRSARIAPESRVISAAYSPRLMRDGRRGFARNARETPENSAQIAHEGGA